MFVFYNRSGGIVELYLRKFHNMACVSVYECVSSIIIKKNVNNKLRVFILELRMKIVQVPIILTGSWIYNTIYCRYIVFSLSFMYILYLVGRFGFYFIYGFYGLMTYT